MPTNTSDGRPAACHQFLLRLAGRIPDALLAEARALLAEDRTGELAGLLARALCEECVPVRPCFLDDHPLIDDKQERAALLAYLRAGEILLSSTARFDDVVERDRRGAVRTCFRTDGDWIWTDHVNYYLQRYGFAPDPALLAHIRKRNFASPRRPRSRCSGP